MPEFVRPLRQLLFALSDRFNPPGLDPTQLLRARLVTLFTVAVDLWIPVFSLAAVFVMGAWRTGLAIALCGATMMTAPFVMKRWGVAAGATITTSSMFATALVSSLLNGGADLHSHMTMALAPVLAASLGGPRSAIRWTVIVLFSIIGLFAMKYAGIELPSDMPLSTRPLFQLMSACTLSVILMCLVLQGPTINDRCPQWEHNPNV